MPVNGSGLVPKRPATFVKVEASQNMEAPEDKGHPRESRGMREGTRSWHRIARFKFSDTEQFWGTAKSRTGSRSSTCCAGEPRFFSTSPP